MLSNRTTHGAKLEPARIHHFVKRIKWQFGPRHGQISNQVSAISCHDYDAVHPPETNDETDGLGFG